MGCRGQGLVASRLSRRKWRIFLDWCFARGWKSCYTSPSSLRRARVAAKFGQDMRIDPVPAWSAIWLPTLHKGREPAMSRIPLNRSYEQSENLKDKLEMSTAEIGLAVRTTNCLEERGVFTVNDLLHCTREDLLSISNF